MCSPPKLCVPGGQEVCLTDFLCPRVLAPSNYPQMFVKVLNPAFPGQSAAVAPWGLWLVDHTGALARLCLIP